jgi:hypothetical protein
MGVDEALDTVNKVYVHGLRRTGLESSVNFLVFPFSFQKHLITNIAQFMSKDMGRVTMTHDALKVWDTINARYDLPKLWADYLPVLSELRKFNPLAYGISAGEFGGVNRANYEMLKRMPVLSEAHDAIANAFLPQAWEVKTNTEWDERKRMLQRILPIWREAEDLYQTVVEEQGNVIGSPTHLSKRSEIEAGWTANAKLNDDINMALDAAGISYSSAMAAQPGDDLYPVKQTIASARYDLYDKYPSWYKSKLAYNAQAEERDAELRRSMLDPQGPEDQATIYFESQLANFSDSLGFNVKTDAEAMPKEAWGLIRQLAMQLAREVPGWNVKYRVYYQRTFGPIERTI